MFIYADQKQQDYLYRCVQVPSLLYKCDAVLYSHKHDFNICVLCVIFSRNAALNHGMFHQVRVDGGREFYLILGIQEIFSHLRNNQDIQPYKQTQSKQVREFSSFESF